MDENDPFHHHGYAAVHNKEEEHHSLPRTRRHRHPIRVGYRWTPNCASTPSSLEDSEDPQLMLLPKLAGTTTTSATIENTQYATSRMP